MNKVIIGLLLAIVAAGAMLFVSQNTSINKVQHSPNLQSTVKESNKNVTGFSTAKKSAHYESNTPEHGITLAGIPINVVINFNFDLATPSEIKIEKDGKDYGLGETVIDENKLSMRRSMDPAAADGAYTANYNACWPDGSCHDGYFQFAIDSSLGKGFINNTNQNTVEIKMSEIMFKPQNIRVSQGTKITWVNDDSVEHYVNTDSHPAHTYYKEQNSKSLKKGESYSLTFDKTGIYPYHCSAHADKMTGNILAE